VNIDSAAGDKPFDGYRSLLLQMLHLANCFGDEVGEGSRRRCE
jgi:hypothetical protein